MPEKWGGVIENKNLAVGVEGTGFTEIVTKLLPETAPPRNSFVTIL